MIGWAGPLVVAAHAVLALASVSYGQQQFDSVFGDRGTPTYGTIEEVSRTQISINTNSGKKLFPVNEIQKVTFKGEPRELRNARDAIIKGQLESAPVRFGENQHGRHLADRDSAGY